MINIQNVTLKHMTQTVKLCMSIGTNICLSQTQHDLTAWNRQCLQQGMSQLLYLKELYQMKETYISTVFQKILENTCAERGKVQTWKSNAWPKTNKQSAQKDYALCQHTNNENE